MVNKKNIYTVKFCFRNVIPCHIDDRVAKKKFTQIVIIAGPIVEDSQIIFTLKICFRNVILAISMVKKSQKIGTVTVITEPFFRIVTIAE